MEGFVAADWSIDRIEQALLAEEELVSRARARQMMLLAVADQLQVASADGCRSLGEWVTARLDVSANTGRRLVAMARRVSDDPDLVSEMAEGTISFDRAEVTSKIPVNARHEGLDGLDVAGLSRVAAKHRRLSREDEVRAHVSQHLVVQPNLDESIWRIWGALDSYGGAVFDKVLSEEADALPDLPDGRPVGFGYRRALALTKICEDHANPTCSRENVFGCEGEEEGDPADGHHHHECDGAGSAGRVPLVTVFVDGDGAEVAAGPSVGLNVIDRIACTGLLEVINTVDGEPLAVGRKTRVISPKLRRFVLHRDGGCVAEGCVSRYRLEPHHVRFWTRLGPTDPENLVTLCWFHHHVVVHGWNYDIDSSRGPGRIRFIAPARNHDPPDG